MMKKPIGMQSMMFQPMVCDSEIWVNGQTSLVIDNAFLDDVCGVVQWEYSVR